MDARRLTTVALFAAYLSTIVLANWLIVAVGLVAVAPGLVAPAGVYAAAMGEEASK